MTKQSVSVETPEPEPARTAGDGYWALISGNRNFRSLWLGQIVSLLGDWFNLIASAALIAELTSSGLAVGALFVVRMLAPFAVSPLAGVVADRYSRRTVLLLADFSRAVVVLGFLLVREPSHVWLLYALTVVQLGISGFFYPARTSILPEIVAARQVGAANALTSATWSAMLALGAALGGLVSGTLGIYPAFAIDSATFLLSAYFIWQIRSPGRPRGSGRESGGGLEMYLDGLRYIWRNRDILVIALQKAMVAFVVSSGFQVVQVEIAEDVFSYGEAGGISLGLMFAVAGLGTGIGPIVGRRFTGDAVRPLTRAILAGYLLCTAGLLITAPLHSFGLVLLGALLRGTGGGMIWVFSTQLLLQLAPGRMQGRVFATEFAIFTLAGAIAAGLTGWVLDAFLSLEAAIWWMGGLCLVPLAGWWLWISRRHPSAAQKL